jgi:hypothetical protein
MKYFILSALCVPVVILFFSGCEPQKVELWNGRDFTGWYLFIPGDSVDVNDVWSVRDGVVHCTGMPKGYMRTEKDYANYTLHVEWRWVAEAGNSGVLLHAQAPEQVWPSCIEAQLKSGSAGDFVLIRGNHITVDSKKHTNTEMYLPIPKKQEGIEKPVGEWNSYKITCSDDQITIYVNGVLQNQGSQASLHSGKIALQSEGAPIEFRNIYLELLD